MGITVLLDVVHSHAVKNGGDGLNYFDGTHYQYFHEGERGYHKAWDTKLFNYNKNEVIHFLLSNLKYWMEIFHFDGFRFDGVTSMLYHDHGLGSAFTNYGMYFSMNTDTEAVTYLQLANELIHSLNKNAITVAEDMSGMPGMCIPIKDGGIGFDYRLSMGVPDLWIKLIKEYRDQDWDMFMLWHELTSRRIGEKAIGYCESHDQALVGDKTIMFRLCDADMYWFMNIYSKSDIIDRGIALHKMIRLITATTVGEGYLNFMGNEFGHPEWIDFPREGNNWSHQYARRQWSLAEKGFLRYVDLRNFDKAMIHFAEKEQLLTQTPEALVIDQEKKILIFRRMNCIFAANFNPTESFDSYGFAAPAGKYSLVLDTDQAAFGGFSRLKEGQEHFTLPEKSPNGPQEYNDTLFLYLPARTMLVLKKED
jgi:1,4-alpha-glucan branching enzyme